MNGYNSIEKVNKYLDMRDKKISDLMKLMKSKTILIHKVEKEKQ